MGASYKRTVFVTNNGASTLTISGFAASGDYIAAAGSTSPCGGALPSGDQCSIDVTFKPTQTGLITGSLSVSDNASVKLQTAESLGNGHRTDSGFAGQSDFCIPTARRFQRTADGYAHQPAEGRHSASAASRRAATIFRRTSAASALGGRRQLHHQCGLPSDRQNRHGHWRTHDHFQRQIQSRKWSR